jgi:hypothetical protein
MLRKLLKGGSKNSFFDRMNGIEFNLQNVDLHEV